MTDNNVDSRKNFEPNGKFAKGNNVSNHKRNRTQTDKLLKALKKAGKNQIPPKNFWDVVAKKAFIDRDIMKAIINKLVPTTNEITGAGGEPININLIKTIYSESLNESNEP